ncbi:MAG: hypothetical protein F4Y57_02425 [Acidobacteria bacterium]|nr:hypothetical protein [Acidobacteriota bacterium]
MDERSKVLMTTLLGAVLGGLVGCLYLTDRGRQVRGQLEPLLDTVVDELLEARRTVERARAAVAEGRRVMDDIVHPPPAQPPWESRDAG